MLTILFFVVTSLVILALLFLNVPLHKSEGVEAGFDPLISSSETPFSLQFLFLMLIFVLFDLELLFFLGVLFKGSIVMSGGIMCFIVLTLLGEWSSGKIKWLI